jgi:cytochrome P450
VGFDPFTPEAIADPYPQYAHFRRTDPVHKSPKLRAWVLFRYDDVRALFRDDEHLGNNRVRALAEAEGRVPPPQPRSVASDPPEHTPLRAILNASLTPRVRAIGPQVESLVSRFTEALAEAVTRVVEDSELAGTVDLIDAFAYPLPIRVICDLFDVPEDDRAQFQTWSHAVARGMDRFYSSDEAGRGLQEFHTYFTDMVRRRRGSRGDDLVHRLLAGEHQGEGLTEDEVIVLCTSLVFGGHETTVNLIGNGMLALLERPDALERVRADAALTEHAVEELLRFDSPVQLLARTARQDLVVRGQRIAAGESVLAGIGAANRDPEVFAEPDLLDVGREPNPDLTFGLGTHVCPGAQLSRVEARAALPALLRRFPRIRFGATPPVRRPTGVLRGLAHLPVRLD